MFMLTGWTVEEEDHNCGVAKSGAGLGKLVLWEHEYVVVPGWIGAPFCHSDEPSITVSIKT